MRIDPRPEYQTGDLIDSLDGQTVRVVGRLLRGEAEPLYHIIPEGGTRVLTVRECALLGGVRTEYRDTRYRHLPGRPGGVPK